MSLVYGMKSSNPFIPPARDSEGWPSGDAEVSLLDEFPFKPGRLSAREDV